MKKSKRWVHKMEWNKVKAGYNPMKPLCGMEKPFLNLSSDWKQVNCQKCHMIRGHCIPRPSARQNQPDGKS